MLNMQ